MTYVWLESVIEFWAIVAIGMILTLLGEYIWRKEKEEFHLSLIEKTERKPWQEDETYHLDDGGLVKKRVPEVVLRPTSMGRLIRILRTLVRG